MSRTRRATWTFASNTLFTIITLVTGMVATPRIVAWLGGPAPFGAFRAASDWGGWISLLELGITGGVLSLLAQALGRGDDRAVRQTLAAGIRAAGFVCGLMLLAGAGLAAAMPHLMTVSPAYTRDLRLGFAISVLGCLSFPLQPFRALTESRQRGYLVNGLIIIQCFVTIGLSLLLAWAGWGIAGQFLAVLVGSLAMPAVLAWEGSRRYPGVLRQAWSEPIPPDLRRSLWSLNRASMILNVCGRLSLYTDTIIVAYLMDAAVVAPFYVTQRFAAMAQNQLMAVGNSTWAGLADLQLKGQLDVFAKRLGELSKLMAIGGLTVLIPIVAYNRELVHLWFRPENYYAGDAVTALAAANALLLPFTSLWSWMFVGMGRTPRLVPTILVGTALNFAVSVAATRSIGVAGPLLGTLVAYLGFYSWRLPLLLRQEFGVPLRPLLRSVMPALILGVPCTLGAWWIARAYPPRGWLPLAFAMTATALIFPPLAWALILDREERDAWGARVRSLARRFVPVPDAVPVGHPETRADGGLIEVEGTGPTALDAVDESPVQGPAR